MSSIQVLALSGKKGVGKDEFATIANRFHGYHRIAFGDYLKDEVADHFGVPRSLFDIRSLKEMPTDALAMLAPFDVPGYRPHARSPREVMQGWGDWRRATCGEAYFVTKVLRKMAEHPTTRWVVTDVRTRMEFSALRAIGATIVRIERDTSIVDEHNTETALDGAEFDAVFDNDGSLSTYHLKVRRWLAQATVAA
jgi:hypothetical protein